MGISSEIKFALGDQWEILTFCREIRIPIDELEDLASIIHEINELELTAILGEMGLDIALSFDNDHIIETLETLLESKVSWYELLEQCGVDISHIISPYGYCTLIGFNENKVEW